VPTNSSYIIAILICRPAFHNNIFSTLTRRQQLDTNTSTAQLCQIYINYCFNKLYSEVNYSINQYQTLTLFNNFIPSDHPGIQFGFLLATLSINCKIIFFAILDNFMILKFRNKTTPRYHMKQIAYQTNNHLSNIFDNTTASRT